jgi:hypothetical protein
VIFQHSLSNKILLKIYVKLAKKYRQILILLEISKNKKNNLKSPNSPNLVELNQKKNDSFNATNSPR